MVSFGDKTKKRELECFKPVKTPKPQNPPGPDNVSVDPLYESTDKYRRVCRPPKMDELITWSSV